MNSDALIARQAIMIQSAQLISNATTNSTLKLSIVPANNPRAWPKVPRATALLRVPWATALCTAASPRLNFREN